MCGCRGAVPDARSCGKIQSRGGGKPLGNTAIPPNGRSNFSARVGGFVTPIERERTRQNLAGGGRPQWTGYPRCPSRPRQENVHPRNPRGIGCTPRRGRAPCRPTTRNYTECRKPCTNRSERARLTPHHSLQTRFVGDVWWLRRSGGQKVVGSNPASPTRLRAWESSEKSDGSPLYRSAVDRADITHSV